jgi:L-aspartate oxidase
MPDTHYGLVQVRVRMATIEVSLSVDAWVQLTALERQSLEVHSQGKTQQPSWRRCMRHHQRLRQVPLGQRSAAQSRTHMGQDADRLGASRRAPLPRAVRLLSRKLERNQKKGATASGAKSQSQGQHRIPKAKRATAAMTSRVALFSVADRIRTRFVVVGSGVAGLHTAWRASEDGDVMMLTKRSLFDSATSYAQGGIAAALGAGDSPELHRKDTLAAGAALCDAEAVQVLVEEGPARVRELWTAGAAFDLDPSGKLKLGREAAHSRRRIVHAHGDQTGAEVARTLARKVTESERVKVVEKARVLDLIVRDDECKGVRVSISGNPVEIIADATVLAAGGCGQVYRYTTNPVVATGDGYAIAHRAGVRLTDMEFVQFHPTALDTPENPLSLISEAVRGEGAVLVDESGDAFMHDRHKQADLAPRDIVAREIFRQQQAGHRVFLDATNIGADFPKRFPGIFAICRARGIDPRTDPIPVTPAAHYMMGGVVTGLAGRSSLPRLYACGEVSRTGVHGANRLASNSLLEGLVFAERVARDMTRIPPLQKVPRAGKWSVPPLADRGAAQVAADEIRGVMWDHAGIARTAKGLRTCLSRLDDIRERLPPGATEEANLLDTAWLIAGAALMRKESRGGHYRSDYPRTVRRWKGRHIEF